MCIISEWYGKTRVTSYELWVESLKAGVQSLKARVEIEKCEFESTSYEYESTSYEFESAIYEFQSTSYEFQSTSYEFKSTSYEFEYTRFIKSMKTQVNSLKSSSFPKIRSPKVFGNLWGNLYVQFLVIIFWFTFPLLHGYGWVSKHISFLQKTPKFSTEKCEMISYELRVESCKLKVAILKKLITSCELVFTNCSFKRINLRVE